MEAIEIQQRIEEMPDDARAALRTAFQMLVRCYTEDPCKGVFLMVDEAEHVLTTTGINADYEECFRMVRASYSMFVDTLLDGAREGDTLQ